MRAALAAAAVAALAGMRRRAPSYALCLVLFCDELLDDRDFELYIVSVELNGTTRHKPTAISTSSKHAHRNPLII